MLNKWFIFWEERALSICTKSGPMSTFAVGLRLQLMVNSRHVIDLLIVRCLTPFSTVFQLYHGGQCTYPCLPGVLFTNTAINILSKPLTTYPHKVLLSKRWTAVRAEWILSQWLSQFLGKSIDRWEVRTSDLLFSSPLSTGARHVHGPVHRITAYLTKSILSLNYANIYEISPMIYKYSFYIPRIFLEHECIFCG